MCCLHRRRTRLQEGLCNGQVSSLCGRVQCALAVDPLLNVSPALQCQSNDGPGAHLRRHREASSKQTRPSTAAARCASGRPSHHREGCLQQSHAAGAAGCLQGSTAKHHESPKSGCTQWIRRKLLRLSATRWRSSAAATAERSEQRRPQTAR